MKASKIHKVGEYMYVVEQKDTQKSWNLDGYYHHAIVLF